MWGLVVSVKLMECNPKTIHDPEKIEEFAINVCDFIDMKRFGEPAIVNFGQDACVAIIYGRSIIQAWSRKTDHSDFFGLGH